MTQSYPIGPAIPVAGSQVNLPVDRQRDRVEPLGRPSVARKITAGATSSSTALTSNIMRVSMRATGADIRYVVGVGTQTATTNSHFIASGERLDINVPRGGSIGVIRAGSTDGVLELTELI